MPGSHKEIKMRRFRVVDIASGLLIPGFIGFLSVLSGCTPGVPEPMQLEVRPEPKDVQEPEVREAGLRKATGERVHHAAYPAPDEQTDEKRPAAKQTLEITLDQAVLMAVGENRSVQIAAMDPRIQRARIESTLGEFDPVPYLTSDVSESERPVGSALESSRRSISEQAMGVRGNTPLGMSYDLSARMQRDDSDNVFRTINPQYRAFYGLTIEHPLLKGSGMEANLARYRAGVHQLRNSRKEYRARISDVIQKTVNAYWGLVNAIQQKEVAETARDLASETLDVNEARYEADRIPEVDVLQAKTRVSESKENLIAASNRVNDARDELLRMISPPGTDPEQWNVELKPVSRPEVKEGISPDERRLIDRAIKQRPELQAINEEIKSVEKEIDGTENRLLPEMDVKFSYGFNSLGEERDESFKELEDSEFPEWEVGFSFQYPLGNRAAEGEHREKKLLLRKLKLRKKRMETRIAMEVRRAIRSLESAKSRIETARRSRELSRNQLNAESERQKLGLSTTFQVLELQRNAVDARARLINAQNRFAMARAELKKATGDLVSQYLREQK